MMPTTWSLSLLVLLLLLLSGNGLENEQAACLALDGSGSDETVCGGGTTTTTTNLPLTELDEYGEDLGIRQAYGSVEQELVVPVIHKARQYIHDVVMKEPDYEPIRVDCKNRHDSCAYWAARGECDNNPQYMNESCAPVCQSCDFLLAKHNAMFSPEAMELGLDMGEEQVIPPEHQLRIQEVIREARQYLHNIIYPNPNFYQLRESCKNRHGSCAHYAVLGECRKNPKYMNASCGPVCHACEYQLKEFRCPLDPNAIDAYYPGDLNRMFERITTQPEFRQYEPKALSRPTLLPGDDTELTAPYKLGPWLITLENFVSMEEANRLVELGAAFGYQRSGKQGHVKFDGTYETYYDEGRTSTSAWCANECLTDPVVKAVTERISNLTGAPEPNMEFFQILKYEQGQFYQTHHDLMEHHVRRQEGVRVLTVYIYLSDVEEGGGTNFPTLGLTVMPKLGRVVVWPNTLNDDPNVADNRTDHQALPVIKGVKYGTNAWIHMRDFKTPFAVGCE